MGSFIGPLQPRRTHLLLRTKGESLPLRRLGGFFFFSLDPISKHAVGSIKIPRDLGLRLSQLHLRINLSPFTKDYRGVSSPKTITLFFGGVASTTPYSLKERQRPEFLWKNT